MDRLKRGCGMGPEKLCYKVIQKENRKIPISGPRSLSVHHEHGWPTFTRVHRERCTADIHIVCTVNVDCPLLHPQDPAHGHTKRQPRGDALPLSVFERLDNL